MASGGAQVTRKRLRWIAVQAVVVTVLAVIVVVTLLKPESNSPLSGIGAGDTATVAEGPGGGSQGGGPSGNGQGGPGGGEGGAHNGGQGNGNGGAGGNGAHHGGPSASTGTATASAGGTPPTAPVPVPETSPTRPDGGVPTETPTEDQYADSLGAIDSALR
jgi:hypothetical protein